MFLQVGVEEPAALLDEVLRYTNRDKFALLPGHLRVATHFHFAYTMQAREYGAEWTPPFKTALRNAGLDAALIADFHGDGHPAATDDTRYQELADYYRFCRAQSGDDFLVIPAEEPNAHYGGHWMLAFPKPVRWILSRQPNELFVSEHAKFGKVYRVGSSAEMQDLIGREQGIAWTAHPRTKSSMGFPDQYKDADFFRDSRFLGAGWKQMPSDLSSLRQGVRSLNLLDDMANWMPGKMLLPEADIFQMDDTHEVYAHLNAAYVRLPALPRFDDYGQILEKFHTGEFFISTGEVTLPLVERIGATRLRVLARGTFPLAQMVVSWGDGNRVERVVNPMDSTRAFRQQTSEFESPELAKAKWVRVEVWDVAGNGAFTNVMR